MTLHSTRISSLPSLSSAHTPLTPKPQTSQLLYSMHTKTVHRPRQQPVPPRMESTKPKARHVTFGAATVITYTPQPPHKSAAKSKAAPIRSPADSSRESPVRRYHYVVREGAGEHIEVAVRR